MIVAHLSLDLSPGYEGGHRVYDDDVEGTGADERIRYLQSLLAVVRLGEVEILQIDADGLGVGRVDGVLGVDEGGQTPCLLASAITCRARVVLPLDSGPKISTTRPRGRPPTPRARSRVRAPVGMQAIFCRSSSPMRMIEPFPNCRSIWETAASIALLLSNASSKRLTCVD